MTKRSWLVAILFAALFTRADLTYDGDGFVSARGFPLTNEIRGDAGTLMEFTWQLWAVNVAIAVVAIGALVGATIKAMRERIVCCALCLAAAWFTWANFEYVFVWSSLFGSFGSNGYGFPFIYESISPDPSPSLFFVNLGLGVAGLWWSRRFFGDPSHATPVERQIVLKWLFAVTLTLLFSRLNSPFVLFGQGYGGFPLEYQSACDYFPCAHVAWVAVGINAAVALTIVYLAGRYIQSPRLMVCGIGICLWLWANLGYWWQLYSMFDLYDDRFRSGFPFPFKLSEGIHSDSARFLLVNMIIGALALRALDYGVRKSWICK